MEKKYIWKHRSKEWIKENPKQGTMYKVYFDEDGKEIPEITKEVVKVKDIDKGTNIEYIGFTPRTNHEPKIKPRLSHKEKKEANNPKNTRGVYVIICEAEKCVYVGQSFNIPNRLRNHKMCIVNKSKQYSYKNMHEHFNKHTISGFQFIDYEYIDNATEEQLLKREGELMAEFAGMGYKLYNNALSKEFLSGAVFCPDIIREDVNSLVKHIIANPNSIDLFKSFVATLI